MSTREKVMDDPAVMEGAVINEEEDTDDEEESVTEVHSLEGLTWRDMRVGQQSAGDIFGRGKPHWPSMPSFTLAGALGASGGVGGTGRGGSDGDDGEPWWRTIGSDAKARRVWMMLGGVLLAIIVAVSFRGGGEKQEGVQSPLSAGTPRRRRDPSDPPSPLRQRLRDVAEAALAQGITRPMPTTFEIIRDGPPAGRDTGEEDGEGGEGKGGGMDFIVSVISAEALKAKAATATPSSSAASSDPFDPRVLDARMTVEDLPPAHSLVLNKFNTMADHALIITKGFQHQEEALTEYDFAAWYRVVDALPGVGFYNSASEAGASQRHKHMQVIPEDSLWDYRPAAPQAIPVDEPISRLIGNSRDLSKVWRIPEFNFRHALCLVPSVTELVDMQRIEVGDGSDDSARWIAEYLQDRYVNLLEAVGLQSMMVAETGSLPPYNAILTTRWLMVVPRSARKWNGVDVNGMGFFGALLVRAKLKGAASDVKEGREAGGDVGVEAVRGPGASAVLEAVTLPR